MGVFIIELHCVDGCIAWLTALHGWENFFFSHKRGWAILRHLRLMKALVGLVVQSGYGSF